MLPGKKCVIGRRAQYTPGWKPTPHEKPTPIKTIQNFPLDKL